MTFIKFVQVTVPFESTSIYDFTGGAFLLSTRLHSTSRRPTTDRVLLRYLPSLTSTEDLMLKWRGLSLGGIQLMDVGLVVHEHDLITALTACVFPCVTLRL